MKVIIAGGREFTDYHLLQTKCDIILSGISEGIEIVSGHCDVPGILTFTTDEGFKVYGADGLAERYAKERNHKLRVFPADWQLYGLAAGPIRNIEMNKYGTGLIAFWDGKSRGTANMIACAKSLKLKVRVINY